MNRSDHTKHSKLQTAGIFTAAVLTFALMIVGILLAPVVGISSDTKHTEEPLVNPTPSPTPSAAVSSTPSPTPDTTKTDTGHTLKQEEDGNWYIDENEYLIIVNKSYRLSENYSPGDLIYADICSTGYCFMRTTAANAFHQMKNAALEEGIDLTFSSAFRDETYQNVLYEQYIEEEGQEAADTYSARGGYSEHETGLVVDMLSVSNPESAFDTYAFAQTEESQWLAAHAHEYGFILRYPEGKEEITGYMYESWHYRYVGVEEAAAIHNAGENISMEEYYAFKGGTIYAEEKAEDQ